eukprot:gene19437-21362_t
MNQLIVTALLACVIVGASASVEWLWPCYGPGHFPDPSSCTHFIQCDDFGKAFRMPCAPGTMWDAYKNTCVHYDHTKCSYWGYGYYGKYINYNKCYKHGPGYYPDPYNCNKFIQCDNFGKSFHLTCPTGLHFNPKHSVCDWPANVACPYKYSNNHYKPYYGSHHSAYSHCVAGYPGYKPYPHDCSKFIQCDNFGKAFLQQCPSGLYFNPKNNVCDYKQNVACATTYGDQVEEEDKMLENEDDDDIMENEDDDDK